MSDIDPDTLNEGLGLDSEASFRASHPGFDESSTGGPLFSGQLLNGDRRGTIESILHDSIAEKCHAGKRTSSELPDTVPVSRVLSSICSSSGQSQTTTQLSSREFQVENVGRSDQMEDENALLGSPSNTIESRLENAAMGEYTTEEHSSWFDVDSFQPTETG